MANKKSRSQSSQRWLAEHFSDPFVKQAHKLGLRSRAGFKLQFIQERDRLFKPNMCVVDLGASPGGWSQMLAQWIGRSGRIIAMDILPMQELPRVEFLQGDFSDETQLKRLEDLLSGQAVDWVVSDMAPNMSGHLSVDQPRAMYLAELALDFALSVLQPKGGFLTKVFQGEGVDGFIKQLKQYFKTVSVRKPPASRDRSREVYVWARELKKLSVE